QNQIRGFTQRSVFVSDGSMWTDVGGSDRPITFGNNQLLLKNVLSFITSGHGGLFIGEDGGGFDEVNMNALVQPYGIQYAGAATDADGRTVTGILPHAITTGVTTLGIDFQLPMTITSPATDLTSGGGQDNILAVSVPEPGPALLVVLVAV